MTTEIFKQVFTAVALLLASMSCWAQGMTSEQQQALKDEIAPSMTWSYAASEWNSDTNGNLWHDSASLKALEAKAGAKQKRLGGYNNEIRYLCADWEDIGTECDASKYELEIL